MWTTVAKGTSLETLTAIVKDQELPKGTPVRFELTLNMPVAHSFDLPGAEWLFSAVMPEGLVMKDVYSPDDKYKVVVDCESDPVHLAAIVGFVKVHWLALSLITIGIFFTLGYLITAIKVKAELLAAIHIAVWVAIIAGIVLIGYLVYKGVVQPRGGG